MGSSAAVLVRLLNLATFSWLLLGGSLAAVSGSRRASGRTGSDPRLCYVVPEGQDPAALMAVLAPAGFLVQIEDREGDQVLLITEESGRRPDRRTVRSLIAQVGTTIQDPAPVFSVVQFLDEQS